MNYPDIITCLPELDIPFPPTKVKTHALPSEHGILVFFDFTGDVELPAHSHGGQWGTVLEGYLDLTSGGETVRYTPGKSYTIPAGTEHSAFVPAGSKIVDFFEEPDRYAVKTGT